MATSEHDIFHDAATALSTRARLDQLLLDALTEPGLAEHASAWLQVFKQGPLTSGRDALGRLVANAGGAA